MSKINRARHEKSPNILAHQKKSAGADFWVPKISTSWRKGVEAIFETGRLLNEAKAALDHHGQWLLLLHSKRLPFSARWAEKLMAIAKNPRLTNSKYTSILPASVEILEGLGKLPPAEFAKKLRAGDVKPTMKLRDVSIENSNIATRQRHERIVANARKHDLDGRKFLIGVADAPWEGNISQGMDPYPRLDVDQICNFRIDDGRHVREVFASESILYLWVIDRHVFDVPAIFEAWDFEYHFMMTWPKTYIRLGQLGRAQHELVAVGTRGKFKPAETGLRHSTLIVGETVERGIFRCAPPRDRRHSSKPDRLQEMIETTYPQYFDRQAVHDSVAIELFARNHRPGWMGQGYEYPGLAPELGEEVACKKQKLRPAEQRSKGGVQLSL